MSAASGSTAAPAPSSGNVATKDGGEINFSSETPLEYEAEIFAAVARAYFNLVESPVRDLCHLLKPDFKTVSQVRSAPDTLDSIQIRIRILGEEWQKVVENAAQDPNTRWKQICEDAKDIKLWISVLKAVA